MGDKVNMPLIELIRHYLPDVDNTLKSTFELEFEGLMKRLDLAEAVGKTRIERLNKEIIEWYEIVEDEDTLSLHTSVFNKTPSDLIDKYAKGKNIIIMALSMVKVDDDFKDEAGQWLTGFMAHFMNGGTPEELFREENIDTRYHSLSEDQLKSLSMADKINLFGQLLGAPPALISKLYSVIVDALRFTHQTAYFHQLITYRKSITNHELNKESLPDNAKKIMVGLPKIKERKGNDSITSLSVNQTALLFNLLRKQNVIFKDESYQFKENIYIAIQVLTGFNKQNIKKAMGLKEYEDNDKNVVRRKIKKLIN